MAPWLKVSLIALAAVVFIAPHALALWATVVFYRPANLPDTPPEKVLRMRRRALCRSSLRILAYLGLGGGLVAGPERQPLLVILPMLLLFMSMLFRPDDEMIEDRMRELSRQERAARLARRIEKATGKRD